MKNLIFLFFLIGSISILISSCSESEESTTSTTNNSSSIPSCSTLDTGSAVDTAGSGTISFGNKNVSGNYSVSWRGDTPSGGCRDNTSQLSSWSSNNPVGTGSFKHKFIVTSNSTHTLANYWYSDTSCSTLTGYYYQEFSSISVGDNTTGLTPPADQNRGAPLWLQS